ncbi:MAG: hypothetical protein WBK51_02105 [Polaromonas sp.]
MNKLSTAIVVFFFAVTSAFAQGTATAETAPAITLSNVKNFDSALLIGKTCLGTFSTETTGGNGGENSMGAYRLRFLKKEDILTATLERKYGKPAYQSPDTKVPFDNLGEMIDLKVEGKRITFANSLKTEFTLTYNEGDLKGELDPTKGGRFTIKAIVNLRCS